MKFRRSLAPFVLTAFALMGAQAGCRHEASVHAQGPQPPAGQVWVTAEQMKEGQIGSAVVDEQDIDDTLLTSGKVSLEDSRVSHVFSPVSGRVTRIDAELGKRVKKGDSLAVIESPDLGIASSDLGKAEADRIAAEHDFERQKELYAAHAASQKDYEQAEDAYRKAKAEVDRARIKARLLRAGDVNTVTQTYALRAEIDGEVLARTANPGVEVQGQYSGGTAVELFTIGEADKVWVVADVFEMDLPRVKVGSPVVVKVTAYPQRTFVGTVDWVSGTLDPTTRTAKVRCTFDNSDRALKPEMYATVQISVDQKKSLAIPRSAVVRLGDQTVVFVEKGQTAGRTVFERVPITVDEGEGGKWLPVSRGLDKGQRVVTSGAVMLSGML